MGQDVSYLLRNQCYQRAKEMSVLTARDSHENHVIDVPISFIGYSSSWMNAIALLVVVVDPIDIDSLALAIV